MSTLLGIRQAWLPSPSLFAAMKIAQIKNFLRDIPQYYNLNEYPRIVSILYIQYTFWLSYWKKIYVIESRRKLAVIGYSLINRSL